MNAHPAIVLNQRGFGKIFSTKTRAESNAIQIKFITPSTNNNSISSQQQPTQ